MTTGVTISKEKHFQLLASTQEQTSDCVRGLHILGFLKAIEASREANRDVDTE